MFKNKFLFLFPLLFLLIFFFVKIYFQPIAVVVPHHNFVKDKRLEYLYQIANGRLFTQKIILIGPDHFSSNQSQAHYADRQWRLSNGNLDFDKSLESSFKSFVNLNNNLLKDDHAIYNILPDIKTVWPKATVFPILIGQNYQFSKLDSLVSIISQNCGFNCLLIASVDFSHYLPSGLAQLHDYKSLKELNNQNFDQIKQLEVDSPQSLYVLAKFAKSNYASKWNLFFNSNSGKLSNNPDIETTSYVMGDYQKKIFKNQQIDIQTSLISRQIDKTQSLSSLGARFFYGTDYLDLDYSPKSPIQLPFNLPNNLVVSILKTNRETIYHFFPTETKNNQTILFRGHLKLDYLNQFFNQTNFPQNCHIDSKNWQLICY